MFGFYGKIPAHGDFIRARGDVSFINEWDQFLQQGMAKSRETLRGDWDAAYQNAPIWRFVLDANVCGKRAMTGVLMPSQDRVGRRFPLTLFHPLEQGATPALLDHEPLMTELENAALACLDTQIDKGALSGRLDVLPFVYDPENSSTNGRSYWLSTFYAGAPRRDSRRFDGMPEAAQFAELLSPDRGLQDV
ncbi:type VI secretion system-associated protein TagF [Neptunicoccus sediminis]|uniref:type VI secretion system-associated protein TagF n=1 Tax=Neptunicoccus sediminis TaxID=1892596 RepID=UPI000845F414|nr:type VI secretion system-associated protein TagF [Neptunicoccus sediminis]